MRLTWVCGIILMDEVVGSRSLRYDISEITELMLLLFRFKAVASRDFFLGC